MTQLPTPIEIPSGYTAKIDGNQITFEPVKPKYPTWEDAIGNTNDLYNYDDQFDKVFSFLKCLQWLRNEWNRIDGFVADWTNESQKKHVVKYNDNEIIIDYFHVTQSFLYFQSKPTAELFLDTFRDKIEVCKEFIN
jgi:hypothetical protein